MIFRGREDVLPKVISNGLNQAGHAGKSLIDYIHNSRAKIPEDLRLATCVFHLYILTRQPILYLHLIRHDRVAQSFS